MIRNALNGWRIVRGESAEHAVLVLHTSCLNYDLGELKRLDGLPFPWILPDNVYWELVCMRDSPYFRERAEFLLRKASRATWNLEQFYEKCAEPVDPADILLIRPLPPMVFLFGDLLKQDEFLHHVRPADNLYIVLRSAWDAADDTLKINVCALSKAKQFRMCKPIPTGQRTQIGKLSALKLWTDAYCRGRAVHGYGLRPTNMDGAYANIYTDDNNFPGQLVKCYKAVAYKDAHLERLQRLRDAGQSPPVRGLPLAMPLELLYCPQGCAGYTMRRCRGELLRVFVRETGRDWDSHDLVQIFRNLFRILLELHTAHILVNDLSYNNVLIDAADGVSLVDCDSFQIRDYPGGSVTPFYCHPEIEIDDCYNVLREPRHEYFALAVLLWQCLFLSENPLTQVRDGNDERSPDWHSMRFPLDVHGVRRDALGVEGNILDIWRDNPEPVRKAFADAFHFRQDISIGAWIRTLGLYEPY
ncbi:MAG: hypothetical protein IJR72_00680 [Oscillospiraceae bacterium]|nr:hypothetical protein [Oscillospiraceae bacterium]